MSFFSKLTDSLSDTFEIKSPAEDRIDAATSSDLSSPDWQLNMSLVDFINRSSQGTVELYGYLRRRLARSQPQTVFLSLVLLETFIKNGRTHVLKVSAAQETIDIIAELVQNQDVEFKKVQAKALALLYQWALRFGPDSSFGLCLTDLKAKQIIKVPTSHKTPLKYVLG